MSEGQHSHHERQKLDRAFVGGVAWTAGAKWLSQLVSWPSVLISARLLSPTDFGIVEMAGFYFVVTNVLAEFGIGTAVLQLRELDDAIVAQLNTVAMLSGLLAFVVSVAAAPLIAAFFHTPELSRLVVVTSTSFILTALQAIPLGLLQRELDYRRLSLAESVQAVVMASVSVACAYAGWAYWSLIAGNLVGRAANLAMTRYWRPVPFAMPRWSMIAVPFRFGMEIAAQRLTGTINLMSDGMVIGRTLGPSPLGVYRMAINLATAPSEKIGSLVMRVTAPLFARVQSDTDLLRRYFLIFTESLSMAIFPLVFGLAIVAPEAIQLLLGPKWAGAASPLRWLAIFMAVRTLSYLTNQLLTTLRYTRFGMWMSFLTFASMPLAFFIASRRGLGAVAAAWLVMSPITVVPPAIRVFRAIRCGLPEYLRSLMPALVGSAAMLGSVLLVRIWPAEAGWPVFGRVAAEVAAGGTAYLAIVLGLYRGRIMQYFRFFQQLRQPATAASAV